MELTREDRSDPETWVGFLATVARWTGEAPTLDTKALIEWIAERRAAHGMPPLGSGWVEEALGKAPEVFATVYSHRHGDDIAVCASMEAAEASRQSIAAREWDGEMGNRARPKCGEALADQYFETMGERSGREESFAIMPTALEGF